MKKNTILFAVLFSWLNAGAQEVLPDRSDTGNIQGVFQARFNLSFLIPHKETTDFQAKSLGDIEPKKRLFRGEMQMLWFVPWWQRDHMFEPQFRFDARAYPGHYISSSMGFGVSCRPLGASIGIFTGQYYRQVPSDGNFVTRRKREFDNYPMRGAYMEASDHNASFYFSVTFEEKRTYFGTRIAGKLGHMFDLGKDERLLHTLEGVVSSEPFSGSGAGFSIELLPKVRTEVLWIIPTSQDRNDQARLGNKLTSGVLASVSCYVN